MVNTNLEEDKPDQASAQQRPSAPEVFNGNIVVDECDMDSDLDHVAQGAGLGVAQGL